MIGCGQQKKRKKYPRLNLFFSWLFSSFHADDVRQVKSDSCEIKWNRINENENENEIEQIK